MVHYKVERGGVQHFHHSFRIVDNAFRFAPAIGKLSRKATDSLISSFFVNLCGILDRVDTQSKLTSTWVKNGQRNAFCRSVVADPSTLKKDSQILGLDCFKRPVIVILEQWSTPF